MKTDFDNSTFEQSLKRSCQGILREDIQSLELESSGEHSRIYKLKITRGSFFVKWMEINKARAILEQESRSLEFIRNTKSINVPDFVSLVSIEGESGCGMILQWIDRKIASADDLSLFGRILGSMHKTQSTVYGWHENNYISILAQKNSFKESWSEFYLTCRIEPLVKIAVDRGYFDFTMTNGLKHLTKRLENEVPRELPSLLHGDLWGGNYLISEKGEPYIFDPATYFGHREMDLAMSLLFSSFGRHFYTAYLEEFPMEPGFNSRLDLHQLYPLLVHSILFQGDYTRRAIAIITG